MNARIQAVTFDVGGTLIEPWPSVGHVYSDVAAHHGCQSISPDLITARFKEAWHSQGNFDYTRVEWAQLVDQIFQGLVPTPVPFFDKLYERFAEPQTWRLFDDVRPALETLASTGIRLGVISNWDERLRILLERLQLNSHFEVRVVSCEIGFAKPSRAIFDQAAARFGLKPGSVLHIGDSLEMDFRGAIAAGFHALHLDRSRTRSDGTDIHTLIEVPVRISRPISSHESFLSGG